MRIINPIGSIKRGELNITSKSESDWSSVRSGTLIKFNEDNFFCTAVSSSKKQFVIEFEALTYNSIKINQKIDSTLYIDDIINISYGQWEVATINKIVSPGEKYKTNETLLISEGIPSVNRENGFSEVASFTVEDTNDGKATNLSITSRGRYIENPPEMIELKSRVGSGLKVELQYRLIEPHIQLERSIEQIGVENDETIIILNYPLPVGVKKGNIITDKWHIQISNPYLGNDKNNQLFDVVRDFTTNYNLPLILPNSRGIETSINHAFVLLDSKIKELENKLNGK